MSNGLSIKVNIGKLLTIVLLIMELSFCIIPKLANAESKIPIIAISLLWYMVHIVNRGVVIRNSKIVFVTVLWIVYMLLFHIIGYSKASIGNYYLWFLYFDIVIKSIIIHQSFSPKEKNFVLRLLQILIVYSTIRASIAGFEYFGINNSIQSAISDYTQGSLDSVGTMYYNMLAFFVGSCMYLLFNDTKIIYKTMDIIGIASSLFFLLMINPRTHAVVLTVMLCMSIILLEKKMNGKGLSGILIFLMFLVLVFAFRNEILSLMPNRIAIRIDSVIGFLNGSQSYNAYLGRITLAMNSIKTYFLSAE